MMKSFRTHHFFAQITESLVSQAESSGKRSISERDIINLMRSQGQISARNTLPFLARRYLPRELSDLISSTNVDEVLVARRHTNKQSRPKSRHEDEEQDEQNESV